MGSIVRATAVYLLMLIVFRLAGNRSIGQLTAFDFVLLMVISEAIQQALIGNDFSLTNAVILVVTLALLDIMMSLWKRRSPRIDRILDGTPVVVMQDGHLHRERMWKERVDETDILAAARQKHGLESLDDIRHAVVEITGTISVIPKHRG